MRSIWPYSQDESGLDYLVTVCKYTLTAKINRSIMYICSLCPIIYHICYMNNGHTFDRRFRELVCECEYSYWYMSLLYQLISIHLSQSADYRMNQTTKLSLIYVHNDDIAIIYCQASCMVSKNITPKATFTHFYRLFDEVYLGFSSKLW